MREVAALAGVSLKTVSRVVNREGGVSPEVTSRVQRAVHSSATGTTSRRATCDGPMGARRWWARSCRT